jgi:hypothetical protein
VGCRVDLDLLPIAGDTREYLRSESRIRSSRGYRRRRLRASRGCFGGGRSGSGVRVGGSGHCDRRGDGGGAWFSCVAASE